MLRKNGSSSQLPWTVGKQMTASLSQTPGGKITQLREPGEDAKPGLFILKVTVSPTDCACGWHPPLRRRVGAQTGGHMSAQKGAAALEGRPRTQVTDVEPSLRAECPGVLSLMPELSPLTFAALRASANWGAGDGWREAAGGWQTMQLKWVADSQSAPDH